MANVLFKDGKIVFRDGSVVFTGDASSCACCTTCDPCPSSLEVVVSTGTLCSCITQPTAPNINPTSNITDGSTVTLSLDNETSIECRYGAKITSHNVDYDEHDTDNGCTNAVNSYTCPVEVSAITVRKDNDCKAENAVMNVRATECNGVFGLDYFKHNADFPLNTEVSNDYVCDTTDNNFQEGGTVLLRFP